MTDPWPKLRLRRARSSRTVSSSPDLARDPEHIEESNHGPESMPKRKAALRRERLLG
jgi:hypothetical protein